MVFKNREIKKIKSYASGWIRTQNSERKLPKTSLILSKYNHSKIKRGETLFNCGESLVIQNRPLIVLYGLV